MTPYARLLDGLKSVAAPAAGATPTLRSRVLRAGTWTLAGHIAAQVLRLGGNLVMTRLLAPEMFGIMSLATVLMVGLHLFSDFGLRQSIVQSPRHDRVFLDTVWTVQILRGALVCVAALGLAGALHLLAVAHWLPAASVYAEPAFPAIVAVISISQLIQGFESTKLFTASRNLVVGRLILIDLGCQLAGLALMLGWAFIDRSIWALVAGGILSGLLRVPLSHFALPGEQNRWHWDRQALREIISFGKWIFLTSILGFLAASGDRLMLGGLTDARTLGMYSIALFMVGALRDAFVKLIGDVAFPALSEVARERPAMLRATYYKFRQPLDIATLLITGLLFTAGHLVVQVLYDDRYLPVGQMLEILCIALFEVRYAVAVQCFIALGKPKLLIPITGTQVVALYAVMPVVFAWAGLEGALWVAGGSVLFTLPVTLYQKLKLGLFDARRELLALPWLACGLVLGWAIDRLAGLIGWPG